LHPQRQHSPQRQPSPSADDQWYVAKDDQKYGPVHFHDLARLAGQGLLLEDDWIWKSGLDSWIPAAELAGLFTEVAPRRSEPRAVSRTIGENSAKHDTRPAFKERAKHQIKDFLLMAFYLWIVFGMLELHKSIVLSQHQIGYVFHGLAVVNALVFAKVMLIAEDLRLGHRIHDKPLVYSVLVKSILFAIALICFHILESVLVGMWNGKTIGESAADVGANRLAGIVSLGIMGTIALVPFFVLSEIGRVIGGDKLWALFFQRRNT
jgi:hypothetical protein